MATPRGLRLAISWVKSRAASLRPSTVTAGPRRSRSQSRRPMGVSHYDERTEGVVGGRPI